MTGRWLQVRRALVGVCVLACVWAILVALTGGFAVRLGSLRVSSRESWTAALIAIASAGLAGALRFAQGAQTSSRAELAWWRGLALAIGAPLRPFARRVLVPAVLLAILAAGLNVAQWLRGAPLWVDEEMIALNIRDRSFMDLGGTLWLGQSAPLGWLVAQRAVLLTLGPGELALRLVPLLFGIGMIACAAWIGQRWMGRLGASLLVVLCAIAQGLSHFRFELKHYSADAFWALLLPALGARALEANTAGNGMLRRHLAWWTVAAIGLWFANGALLVVPGCAVFMLAVILRRNGGGPAARFCVAGVVWLASFAANYALSLRYTHHNRYLRSYWGNQLPPESSGAAETLIWIVDRLEPLAENPAATALAPWLWGCAVLGLALAPSKLLGGLIATVPLSAFALAALRLVPLHERFALWIVPALYAGIALLFDRGLRECAAGWASRQRPRAVLGALLAAVCLPVSADIVAVGTRNLDIRAPRTSNHALDDRSAIRWLMQHRIPGDALATTRLGWPAVWWYGGISLRDPWPDGRLPDGSVMYQLSRQTDRAVCGRGLEELSKRHSRVLVYTGFPDEPAGFYELLLHDASPLVTVTAFRQFSGLSRVTIFELRDSSSPENAPPRPAGASDPALEGCIAARPVRRW